MSAIWAAVTFATGLWVIAIATTYYEPAKRPAGEAWVVTASDRLASRPMLVRANVPYTVARSVRPTRKEKGAAGRPPRRRSEEKPDQGRGEFTRRQRNVQQNGPKDMFLAYGTLLTGALVVLTLLFARESNHTLDL